MRILVLGGTVFLGRAVAQQALAARHDVTCAARGSSGNPVDGVRFVRVDRDDPAGLDALDGKFDAVVDVARQPAHLRHALASLAGRVGHFTFVSTGSVYADNATVGQRADTAPVLPPAPRDAEDPSRDAESYGSCKVSGERLVTEAVGAGRAFVCRAGLIVGPEDPSGRFEYWVRRAARGGEILAPGTPDDAVQFIDVRDLAAWIVEAVERGLAGTYDGIAAPISRREFLAAVVGEGAPLTYVPQEFLAKYEVAPWSGPRSLPLWLPVPEYAGFMSRDVTPSLAAGLRPRPLAATARDTAAWLTAVDAGSAPGGRSIGLTAAEEAELLATWHGSSGPDLYPR
ncbi:NAD-dependent epimerase/dehydratase family protein [Plantactinospora sp. S1510]|uniref:NAD-dependent epimerase/dehydratase family protein n=1 Tax=Plantactinospora alkalitolerans TaxID=2789879 RepID=A0ABS0H0L6_9ACTN|nr:NAD-dependent epimerase/dehydratase family protein [Plantactinospora alkalitolerans]MBF9132005.1 NAD-dependent epimerase/dehydratase family protein [Plantactinospora alkalitolerans]